MDITSDKKPADKPSGNTPGQDSQDDIKFSQSKFQHSQAELPDGLIIPGQFLESLPFPLFIKDLNGTFLACNQHFCDMFGFSAGQIIGKNTNALFEPLSAEIHASADKQLIASGIRVVYETNVSGPEIKYGLVRVIKSPLKDKQGKLQGIIGLISEINSGEDSGEFFENQNSDISTFLHLISNEPNEEDRHSVQEYSNDGHINQGKLKIDKRFDIVLKAMNAGIWDWEPQTGRLLWSEKCFEIFGMEMEVDNPELWMSKIHPEDVHRVHEMWSRITFRAGWFDLEFRILVNGLLRWIKKSGYFVKGNGAVPDKITGIIVDISYEKDFSEKLFDNQRFFKAIIEDQSELICRIRPDGTVTFINKAFARFFGILPDKFLNHLLNEVLSEKEYNRILKLINCLNHAKEVINFDQKIDREPGLTAVIQWTIRVIYGKDDLPEEYQLVGRDVTEIEASREALRRSEEMFRLIAENSNDIISIHPEDGNIDYVSPSVKHILGYLPEDLTGTPGRNLVYEEDLSDLFNTCKGLQQSSDPLLVEFRLKDYHGNLIWFESMIQHQYNNKGEATGKAIAVSRNIQGRKLVEEQQKLTEKQLKEANLTKDKFFSVIAHDLRSPFTSILGFTRLLNDEYDDFPDDERKMMVTQILNSTESTFQLLDNLLAWAKTQLGRTNFNPEQFSLESLVVETVRQTSPQALIKNITITAKDVEEASLFADLNMMRAVLRNLLSNAIKFSFPDGLIELGSKISDDFHTISVTDHGTGIPPESINKLFSLTEQSFTTKGTSNEKGTGLGLILCREFVERNGGNIYVESEVGKGSTFSFTLPTRKGS